MKDVFDITIINDDITTLSDITNNNNRSDAIMPAIHTLLHK